jgi:hypothetical protein
LRNELTYPLLIQGDDHFRDFNLASLEAPKQIFSGENSCPIVVGALSPSGLLQEFQTVPKCPVYWELGLAPTGRWIPQVIGSIENPEPGWPINGELRQPGQAVNQATLPARNLNASTEITGAGL